MGPKMFCRLLYEIRDPVTGILVYGVAFDAVHEYTGVREAVARKKIYGFCD